MFYTSSESLIDYSYGDLTSCTLEAMHFSVGKSFVADMKNIIVKMSELCARFLNKMRELLIKESKAPSEALQAYRKLKTGADRIINLIWVDKDAIGTMGVKNGLSLLESLKETNEYKILFNTKASEVSPDKWVKFNSSEVTQPISKCLKLLSKEKSRLNTLSTITKTDTPREEMAVQMNQKAANATIQVTKFSLQIAQKILSFRSKDVKKKNLNSESAISLDDARESFCFYTDPISVELVARESTNLMMAYEGFNPKIAIQNLIDKVIGLFQRLIAQIRKIGIYYIPKKVYDSFLHIYPTLVNPTDITNEDLDDIMELDDYILIMEKADVYKRDEFVKFDISKKVLGQLQEEIKKMTKYKTELRKTDEPEKVETCKLEIRKSQLLIQIINTALSYHRPIGEPKYQRLDRGVKAEF